MILAGVCGYLTIMIEIAMFILKGWKVDTNLTKSVNNTEKHKQKWLASAGKSSKQVAPVTTDDSGAQEDGVIEEKKLK
jgi:hypothetical protein